MSTSPVTISSDGMYRIYKGISRLQDLTEIHVWDPGNVKEDTVCPHTLMYAGAGEGEGGSLLISLLLVNCTLSSLANSPNQCCKLSLKSPEGSGS